MKFVKIIGCIFLVTFLFAGCHSSVDFMLSGTIVPIDTNRFKFDHIILKLYGKHNSLYGTDTIRRPDKFIFKATVPHEGIYHMDLTGIKEYNSKLKKWMGTLPTITLYIQRNEEYHLNVSRLKYLFSPEKKLIFSTSPSQTVLSDWRTSVYDLLVDSMEEIKSRWIKEMYKAADEKNDSLYRIYADSIAFALDSIKSNAFFKLLKNFGYSNKDVAITPYILLDNGRGFMNKKNKSIWQNLYHSFPEHIQKSAYGLLLKEKIQNIGKLSIGSTVPSIQGISLYGNKFKFDYSKYKLTMIDFWASWCPPCMAQIPKLKDIYSKYHRGGFAIVGVSFDNEKDKWIKTVQKLGLLWYNVYNPNEAKNKENTKSFPIDYIPQNYFINNKGKIVQKNIKPDNIGRFVSSYLSQH